MPYIDRIEHSPDEAIGKGRCPECGRDLAETSAAVEIPTHWPRGLDNSVASAEAIRRAAMLTGYFAKPAPPPPDATKPVTT